MTTAISADTCVQLNETLFFFFVISMVQTIGAINMFNLKLQFHNMAVISRRHSLVLFVVQTVRLHEYLFAKICEKKKKKKV